MRSKTNERKLILIGGPIILALLLGVLIGRFIAYNQINEKYIKEGFNKLYYDTKVWMRTKFLGIESLQNPCDNWAIQEIISELKPDYIIETGTAKGGTALFYAVILEKVNKDGKVITIDIDPQIENAAKFEIFKERVEVISSDSASPLLVEELARRIKNTKVLVVLDSLHTKEHVLNELNLYSGLVSLGSYIVVEDTCVNGNPILPNFGPGPMEAKEEFLKINENFVEDHNREKFLLTFHPSGYLKRVR